MPGGDMGSEPGGMRGAASRRMLHSEILDCRVKFGELPLCKIQDMLSKRSTAGACFDSQKRPWGPEEFPHFRQLACQQAPEDRVNIHAGVVVPGAPRLRARIIPVRGVIEAFAHEVGKRNRPACADARSEQGCEQIAPFAFSQRLPRHVSLRCGLHVNISMTKSCRQS